LNVELENVQLAQEPEELAELFVAVQIRVRAPLQGSTR
jgi:hypothetical protein